MNNRFSQQYALLLGLLLLFLPGPLAAQRLQLDLVALPAQVAPGEWSVIQIRATDEAGAPLAGVFVTIEADAGLFAATEASNQSGKTNDLGLLRTEWSCRSCPAEVELSTVARKAGFLTAESTLTVLVDHPKKEGLLTVEAAITPAAVAPDETATLSVALRREGRAEAGGVIEVASGGGYFLTGALSEELPTFVKGTTDNQGTFQASWQCNPCASSYTFHIRGTIEGHQPVRTSVELDISNKKKAVLYESASVTGKLSSCTSCGLYRVQALALQAGNPDRNVMVSSDCRYLLNLPPGLYQVQAILLKPPRNKERECLFPGRVQVQVNEGKETTVNFNCLKRK